MGIKVTFTIDQDDFVGNDPQWRRLKKRLKKYKKKEKWVDDPIYCLNQKGQLYSDVINYVEANKKRGIRYVNLGFSVEISKEVYQKAAAFVLNFPKKYCEEYEDIENEYKECEVCWTKVKGNRLFYVQPKGYIKRHSRDCGMAGIDGTDECLLLPKLVEKLIKGGVDKSFFEPVLSKKKKVIGYIFVTKSILPKHTFQDSNYGTMRQCNACGHINMEIKEPEYWYRQKTISKMGLKKLKDVNLTYEFYSDYQQKIISKKAARIILRHVKYAELFPVYLRR